MTPLPLDNSDRVLARLWDAAGASGAHASTFTLVAVCATPDELARARGALPSLVSQHPCRTVTVACYPGGAPSITARAALHVDTRRANVPVGEDVDLDVRGDARSWVPSTLVRLRQTDLPLYVWWVGDLPDDDRLFDRLLELADVALVHTADMDLRDLEALSRLVTLGGGAYVIADLTWQRLRSWQEFTARFFDDPAALGHLGSITEVTVGLAPREREPEAASTQAALYAGWLAAALGWDVSRPSWKVSGAEAVATVADAKGKPLTLRFVTDDRPGVYPGAIHRVALAAAGARFEVCRSPDDALVLCWSAEVPEGVVPSQCVRIGAPEEPKMLARTLERPQRDPLFEKSLAAAARLVAPVSARKP